MFCVMRQPRDRQSAVVKRALIAGWRFLKLRACGFIEKTGTRRVSEGKTVNASLLADASGSRILDKSAHATIHNWHSRSIAMTRKNNPKQKLVKRAEKSAWATGFYERRRGCFTTTPGFLGLW